MDYDTILPRFHSYLKLNSYEIGLVGLDFQEPKFRARRIIVTNFIDNYCWCAPYKVANPSRFSRAILYGHNEFNLAFHSQTCWTNWHCKPMGRECTLLSYTYWKNIARITLKTIKIGYLYYRGARRNMSRKCGEFL